MLKKYCIIADAQIIEPIWNVDHILSKRTICYRKYLPFPTHPSLYLR